MLTTINHTPFEAELGILQDKDGGDTAVAVTKATFRLDNGRIEISEAQRPIFSQDQFTGEPGRSSIRYATETTMPKPHADIVMNGHAYGNGRCDIEVGLKVGNCRKVVRVFGDRTWKGLLSLGACTRPLPFETIPLDYEHAFGGFDEHKSNPEKSQAWPANPVGKGFLINGTKKQIKGLALPNIEHPTRRMKDPFDRLTPEGFGYIGPNWHPRFTFAGTYDKAWMETRMPHFPQDFNSGFYNAAHPDLISRAYFTGNEEVVIVNASPLGTLRFRLPKLEIDTVFFFEGNAFRRPTHCDTLILEPDDNEFMMIFRSSFPCDKRSYHVQAAEIRHRLRKDS